VREEKIDKSLGEHSKKKKICKTKLAGGEGRTPIGRIQKQEIHGPDNGTSAKNKRITETHQHLKGLKGGKGH